MKPLLLPTPSPVPFSSGLQDESGSEHVTAHSDNIPTKTANKMPEDAEQADQVGLAQAQASHAPVTQGVRLVLVQRHISERCQTQLHRRTIASRYIVQNISTCHHLLSDAACREYQGQHGITGRVTKAYSDMQQYIGNVP